MAESVKVTTLPEAAPQFFVERRFVGVGIILNVAPRWWIFGYRAGRACKSCNVFKRVLFLGPLAFRAVWEETEVVAWDLRIAMEKVEALFANVPTPPAAPREE